MEKRKYISPGIYVIDLGSEALLDGGIKVKSGENHGAFGAKQQEIVIEDDYYEDEFEDQSEQAFSLTDYKPYSVWDDDL